MRKMQPMTRATNTRSITWPKRSKAETIIDGFAIGGLVSVGGLLLLAFWLTCAVAPWVLLYVILHYIFGVTL